MSLIAISWRAHPDYPLVLLVNRDEHHARDTAPAAWSSDQPAWLGGRDLVAGGTWFGVTRDGRFALVTNFRDGATPEMPDAPTRGELPLAYLASDEEPVVHARRFRQRSPHNPFNLLVGSPRDVFYAATRSRMPLALTQGVHTLSNGLIDQKWPKNARIDARLGSYITTHGGFRMLLDAYSDLHQLQREDPDFKPARPDDGSPTPEEMAEAGFHMLADRTTYDNGLPDTGIDADEELRRSAAFVIGEHHGTRSSSVLVFVRSGYARFEERRYDAAGEETGRTLQAWEMGHEVFSGGGINDA